MWRLAAFVVLWAGAAQAAPPPVGSEDYELMHPYAEWVETQHNDKGYWCCNWSDGRTTDARINADGHWEVHLTRQHFPDLSADKWMIVPDDKVLHHGNPVGIPIVWYSARMDLIYCFDPASGT